MGDKLSRMKMKPKATGKRKLLKGALIKRRKNIAKKAGVKRDDSGKFVKK